MDHPAYLANTHDAVGERIRAWGFEHHRDAIQAALTDITAGQQGIVLGDADIALIAIWALNDRELPDGGTVAERYAQRPDLCADERDMARRIASADLGLLRVLVVQPGRWIGFDDLSGGGGPFHVVSHDVSRTVRPKDVFVARVMEGPPIRSLWGPVGVLTRDTGRELRDLLTARLESLDLHDEPGGIAAAMDASAREITMLLAPGLARVGAGRHSDANNGGRDDRHVDGRKLLA